MTRRKPKSLMVSAMKQSAALPGTPADALEIFTSRGAEQPVPHRLPSSCRGQTVPDLQRGVSK